MKQIRILLAVMVLFMVFMNMSARAANLWTLNENISVEAEVEIGEFAAGSACLTYSDCDHNDLCLDEFCINNVCTPVATVCNDGNACNGVETCNPATGCVAGTPLTCNDGNPCNGVETCNPATGCVAGIPLTCNDGNACNGIETCDPANASGCVAGTPLTCDDGNACNGIETCDPVLGCVAGTPLTCDDGNACNGVETCDPAIGCVAGTPLACDDGNACNGVETCDPATGCVAGTPLTCDDGNACNGVETCDPATGCVAGTSLTCDDGNACNGVEKCDPATGCVPGTPLTCDDGNACNGVETCDPATGCVAGTPLVCDDGDACNGLETCDPATGCVAGTPLNCDDGNACTDDACVGGVCVNTPHIDNDGDGYRVCDGDCNNNNAAIRPGALEICNGVDDDCDGLTDETTFALVSIVNSNIPCNGSSSGGSARVTVSGGLTTYTYLWSNGKTTALINGLAVGTYSVTVTDAGGCKIIASATVANPQINITQTQTNVSTYGGSNGSATATPSGGVSPYRYRWSTQPPRNTATITGLTTGTYQVTVTDRAGCTATASYIITQPSPACTPASCNDGDACNGIEICDPFVGCSSGTPLTCDDGEACNGVETCDPVLGCISLTPASCDDGDPCTIDGCSGGVCVNTPQTDADGDRFRSCDGDCDDSNADIFPGAVEICNGVDDDCDGLIDESSFVVSSTEHTDVRCNGPGGSAEVHVTGGVNPSSYSWSNGDRTKKINGLSAGTYTVTVTDGSGCQVTATIVIANIVMVITQTQTNVTTFGGSNGSATATPSGGVSPYRYRWNTRPPKLTPTITGLSAGTYQVTVTDNVGCTATATYTITQPTAKTDETGLSLMDDKNLVLLAYPNPFSNLLNIEFTLAYDSRSKLQILNVAGQVLAEIFEADVKAGEKYTIPYRPEEIASGIIIYRLQTEHGTFYGKAVMLK